MEKNKEEWKEALEESLYEGDSWYEGFHSRLSESFEDEFYNLRRMVKEPSSFSNEDIEDTLDAIEYLFETALGKMDDIYS